MATPVFNPGVLQPATGTLIEGAIAFGLILAVLVALGDTGLYPVAVGIVILAILYELLRNNTALNAISGPLGWANTKLKGSQ